MNSESNTIIKIEQVSKKYRLGAIGGTTLRDEIQRKTAKLLHKDDPTLIIGQKTVSGNEEFYALNDISLEIRKGEAVGIIGHNGAGKSTLLKLLCRVTAPTKGKISYNGRITSMLEVGTGFHPELTGRENIYLNGAILGMNKKDIDSKIEDIIEFSECRQFIDTPVKRYSSGMYVKLAFSVAANLDSEIMIMDEVLAVGDIAFQKKCLTKMRETANKDGRTILYVSHNMNTIRQLCDRCIVLSKGKIIFDGDVDQAIDIYSGESGISDSVIDLSSYKRTQSMAEGVKITGIRLIDKEKWIYNTGESMRYYLQIEAARDIDNIGYRSRLTTADDTSVSVFLAPNLFSCKVGERMEIPLEVDISQLVPGHYKLTPVLYGVNEFGGWQFYDHLDGAVAFEVVPDINFNENMEWQSRWWGHVKLPQIKDLRKQ